MPSVSSTPHTMLKPYVFHGLYLQTRGNGDQATCECPWCGKPKFYINMDNGLWDCKTCGNKGNTLTFIRKLWEESDKATSTQALDEMLQHRNLVLTETLLEWGVVQSVVTGEWLLPGYGVDQKIHHLYRYVKEQHGTGVGYRVWATPDMHHQLYGMQLFDPKKQMVYVCEGPWDGMALWEVMRSCKWDGQPHAPDSKLVYTSNPASSLLADANVVAVPSTTVFNQAWLPLFAGKDVVLLFDNDHPRVHPKTQQQVPPAGYAGMKRLTGILANAEQPPASIHYLEWGPGGHNPKLADGTDVRDILATGGASDPDNVTGVMQARASCLRGLMTLFKPIPDEWVDGRSLTSRKSGGTELEALPCQSWPVLQQSWRKSMKWTEGLDRALSVMLASITSTRASGDQLWVKIIGPASCGKSTLCEAVTANRKHVKGVSTMRGFHSGFKQDRDQKEDNSLLNQLRDKTLVTKDGDTLLQSPNLKQILAEARDIYDRTSRVHYRNKIDREYTSVNLTWLLCGTASLRSLDSSELGERFLDCVIMEGVDDVLEDEVLDRVLLKARKAAAIQVNCRADSQNTPEMTECMRLTMGYIDHLKENGIRLASELEWPDNVGQRLKAIAKFVSYMRARPGERQEETVEREFAARLLSQHSRLAMFLAVVLGRTSIDDEVLRRTRQTALDTARGWTLQIARCLYDAGENGLDPKSLGIMTSHTDAKTAELLRFLERLKAVERHTVKLHRAFNGQRRYRLTAKLRELYEDVVFNGVKPVKHVEDDYTPDYPG